MKHFYNTREPKCAQSGVEEATDESCRWEKWIKLLSSLCTRHLYTSWKLGFQLQPSLGCQTYSRYLGSSRNLKILVLILTSHSCLFRAWIKWDALKQGIDSKITPHAVPPIARGPVVISLHSPRLAAYTCLQFPPDKRKQQNWKPENNTNREMPSLITVFGKFTVYEGPERTETSRKNGSTDKEAERTHSNWEMQHELDPQRKQKEQNLRPREGPSSRNRDWETYERAGNVQGPPRGSMWSWAGVWGRDRERGMSKMSLERYQTGTGLGVVIIDRRCIVTSFLNNLEGI